MGEAVVLHFPSGDVSTSPIVKLEGGSQRFDDGDRTRLEGKVFFRAQEAKDCQWDGALHGVGLTIRGQRYKIDSVEDEVDGLIPANIVRTDKRYTNPSSIDPLI